MNPHSVYNNILRRKDPADLHSRTLDGDWKQRDTDQLQINNGQVIKIKVKNPRLK
jgi:hypothetical protein